MQRHLEMLKGARLGDDEDAVNCTVPFKSLVLVYQAVGGVCEQKKASSSAFPRQPCGTSYIGA